MPKTSNLRAQVLNVQRAGDKSFTITVSVWEAPGSPDSPSAVRFQFQSHKNPALWWRLSMTSARKGSAMTRDAAKYTNSMYNKALRSATDAMNDFIVSESDKRTGAAAGRKLSPNLSAVPLRHIKHGAVPSKAEFMAYAEGRVDDPFRYYMKRDAPEATTSERAADVADVMLLDRSGMIAIASLGDMYQLICGLCFLGQERGNKSAMLLAASLLGAAGFHWT